MGENKNNNYYLALCMGSGVVYGIVFDQLAIGISLGLVLGIALDSKNNKDKG